MYGRQQHPLFRPAITGVATLLGLLLTPSIAWPQFVTPWIEETGAITYHLTLTAASPQPPLLHNRLLPGAGQQTPGNAAQLYYRAILAMGQITAANVEDTRAFREKIDSWRTAPLDELPQQRMEEALRPFDSVLQEAAFAARRSYCDWDMPIREQGVNFHEILLPEIQEMRDLSRLVAVRARLNLAQGSLDAALANIQTGYAMARHVGQSEFLVSTLVAQAMASMIHEQLLTALTLEDCPNLYWPLTHLPSPLIESRGAFEVEYHSLQAIFPELQEAQQPGGDAAYWDAKLRAVILRVNQAMNDQPISALGVESVPGVQRAPVLELMALRAAAFSQLPRIRRELVEELAYPADEVAAMPGSRAILLYSARRTKETWDAEFAPTSLPYFQARSFYIDTFHARPHPDEFIISGDPLLVGAYHWLPAVRHAHRNIAMGERWMVMLQAVEAIRDYAQVHGQLPHAWDQLSRLPVSVNPLTGQPFRYTWKKTSPLRATLEGDVEDFPVTLRFEIELRQP